MKKIRKGAKVFSLYIMLLLVYMGLGMLFVEVNMLCLGFFSFITHEFKILNNNGVLYIAGLIWGCFFLFVFLAMSTMLYKWKVSKHIGSYYSVFDILQGVVIAFYAFLKLLVDPSDKTGLQHYEYLGHWFIFYGGAYVVVRGLETYKNKGNNKLLCFDLTKESRFNRFFDNHQIINELKTDSLKRTKKRRAYGRR